jgi:hypothetical protein
MTTLNQMTQIIRAENPDGIRVGSDEAGYTQLTTEQYEAKIEEWATARLDKLSKLAEAETAKVAAQTKLAALGLTTDDLKALGLGNN